ncbi:MAG TPA: DUF4136 domain-containing protein [Candidatus Kryptonia bacterium]
MKYSIACFLVALWLAGCSTSQRLTNLTPAYLYLEPSVTAYENPSSDISSYKTFAVFPYSVVDSLTQTNPILEQQLLFYVRNLFEQQGYRFVQLNDHPDFLMTVDGRSQYQERYVPPQSMTLPYWVPSKTITVEGFSSGNLNFNTFGDINSFGWGNWTENSTQTVQVPGYMTTQSYQMPGYTVGHYYPELVIQAYDSKTLQNIWTATGVGTSDNSDVRVSGQLVLIDMVNKFPTSKQIDQPTQTGYVGLFLRLITVDGNSYYPTVVKLMDGMPAESDGVELYDMIVKINGRDTRNMPMTEVLGMMRGSEGSQVQLTVWRLNKLLDFTITRAARNLN